MTHTETSVPDGSALAPDLTSEWTLAAEQTLIRSVNSSCVVVPGTQPRSFPSIPPQANEEATQGPAAAAKGSGLRARLLIVDLAAAVTAWVVLGTIVWPAATVLRSWSAALAGAVVTLALLPLLGLYRSRLCAVRGQQSARIAVAAASGAVVFVLLRGDGSRSSAVAATTALCCVLALITARWGFDQWLRAQRARGRYQRGLIMVGVNEDAATISTMFDSEPELGYEVRGTIGRLSRPSAKTDLPHSDTIDWLPELATQTDSNGVLLVADALSAAEVQRAIELATVQHLHVQIWPGFRGLGMQRIRRLPMSGEAFLYVEPSRHPTWQKAAKRTLDVLGSVIALVIAAPILLLAWVAIRVEDGGPVLFRQVRTGLDERPFVVYKLRTMTVERDDDIDLAAINERTDGPLFKAASDPRVTKVGAILRALSIDEIPQLLNVLTGTMSLVGPRPALPGEVAQFDQELQRRHAVKPGITGLWQLEARDNPSFHAYRRLDLRYVDNWSIGLDLFILLATIPMVITRVLKVFGPEREPREALSEAG